MKTPRSLAAFILGGSCCLSLAAMSLRADVRISEVMTNNVATLEDEDGEFPDWIEVHNDGAEPVDLDGYFLTDDAEDLNQWELPGVSLEPGAYLVIYASGKDRRIVGQSLHTNFQLKNGGEFLALIQPDKETIADAYEPEIPQLDADQSFGVRQMSGKWVLHYFQSPTPDSENSGGSIAETVAFSIAGQPFTGSLELSLSSRSGSAIRYTSDGKRPSLFNGQDYTAPITIDSTKIISASITGGPIHQEVYFQIDAELAAFSSNLPVVIMQSANTITTSRQGMLIAILDPDEESGRTTVDKTFHLSARGETWVRGSSTAGFPKQSFRVELQDADGEDQVMKPLGLPAESDWILSGRYEEDRSLIRNEFTYAISRQIGRYAARTRFCEVYIHRGDGPVTAGDYRGAYSWMESIKRDADRIDIDELTPEHNEEPEVTGGYIFRRDRSGPNETTITGGGESVNIAEPDRASLTPAQRDYLQGYLNQMQQSFSSSDPQSGYPAYIDAGSWIDHHLINVLMLNVDALRLSTYFYKQRNGKVFAGPVWDFNISSGSRDRFGTPPRPSRPDVWRGISGDRGTTFFTNETQRWWGDLFSVRDFQQAYCDRWHELRQGAFSTENINVLIDSMAEELREAQPRNQARWPEVSPEYGGWDGEINHLKQWLEDRVAFVDKELVAPPEFTPAGGAISLDTVIKLRRHRGTLFNSTTLYYTLDGTDPRASGGAVGEGAVAYDDGITLTQSTTIVAREYMPSYKALPDGPEQEWSAPARFQFIIGTTPAGTANLVISELMYHPANPSDDEIAAGFVNDDDFEYLEFQNISDQTIDLLGIHFDDGIAFALEESYLLEPGAHAIIVSHREAFIKRYGNEVPIIGVYTGRLSNAGDELSLLDAAGETIVAFAYDDNDSWPTSADGDGYALVLTNPLDMEDPADPSSWSASAQVGGSPGSGESVDPTGLTYEAWVSQTFSSEQMEVAGKEDDPDGDRMVNLAEFALFGDPFVAETPPVDVAASEDGENVVLSFSQRKGTSGITVAGEVSADLEEWTNLDPDDTEVVDAGNFSNVTWIVARNGASRFLRLRIE